MPLADVPRPPIVGQFIPFGERRKHHRERVHRRKLRALGPWR